MKSAMRDDKTNFRAPRVPIYRAVFAALSTLLVASGCSVPYGENGVARVNTCESDDDCPSGSVCENVRDESSCVADSADLSTVYIEVRPAAGNNPLVSPGLIQLTEIGSGDGSQVFERALVLPPQVQVSSDQVFLPCAKGKAVSGRITFRPVMELAGLLGDLTFEVVPTGSEQGEIGKTEMLIPSGNYNIYVEPKVDLATFPECADATPFFLLKQPISSAAPFKAEAPPNLNLTGTLRLSQKEDFTEWYLEVIEPVYGGVISETIQPEQTGIALEVPFKLPFVWHKDLSNFVPVVRLRPPQGVGKPVMHWRLDGLGLGAMIDNEISVKLDVSNVDTQPRPVEGYTLDQDSVAVPSTVTLRSLSISKMELARYEVVVETEENGRFTTAVPPGDYQVIARPHLANFAIGTAFWQIEKSDLCFCANSVQVPSATTLSGSVSTPTGADSKAEVRLGPASSPALTYLGALSSQQVPPRGASTYVSGNQFKLSVDAGRYDLAVVPTRGSGLPWLVRPSLLVSAPAGDDAAPVISLEPLRIRNPVIMTGSVSDSTGERLSGATIRAWVGVSDANNNLAESAVQIGEAAADENGQYTLLLPPSIQ